MSKKKNNSNKPATQTTENEVVQKEVVETPTENTEETPAPAAEEITTNETPVETDAAEVTEQTETTEQSVEQAPAEPDANETPAPDTEAPVTEQADETPQPEANVIDEDVVQAPVEPAATETTEQPVEQPAAPETPVTEEKPVDQPVTPEASKDKNPKYGPGEQKPATEKEEKPADPTPVAPEATEKPEQNPVDKEAMSKELMTSYDVRFAFSQNSKKFAVARKMTLYNMIEIFVKNRTAFVGVASQAALDHIKDYVLHNPIIYAYQEFTLEARTQFIGRLETNSEYVINHLVK